MLLPCHVPSPATVLCRRPHAVAFTMRAHAASLAAAPAIDLCEPPRLALWQLLLSRLAWRSPLSASACAMTKGSRGTGRKVKGGGKARTNKDHRMDSRRGVVKGRWDDIVAHELRPDATIEGRPQPEVIREKTALDPDKPGLGQFYCVSCCRYLITQRALDDHNRTSKHKRRLKMLLTETPYSHAEANAAAGRGATDHGARTQRDRDTRMDDAT